ncbi:MAG: glycosyltransferase family A protein [Acidobacteriota bacterium]|nr:glycosyltransferase family A protein [Acidobacteriota bacterium]
MVANRRRASSGSEPPEISVVMGVRDGERELGATLASLFAQREVALEVVVVDDGSRDGTPELLARTAAGEPRLRVLRQEPSGLTAALAHGCAAARAPLIARQDCGDLSHPDRLAWQKAALDAHPGVTFVSCWTLCTGPAGEPLYRVAGRATPDRPLPVPLPLPGAPQIGPSSHGSVLFRRASYEAAGGYRREFALGQDWDLWYRLGLMGEFLMVGDPLYLRRLLPESLSFAAHDLQVRFGRLAREAARCRAAGESDAVAVQAAEALSARFARERRARQRRAPGLGAYHLGALLRELGDRRAAGYLAAAVRRRPWDPKAWLRWGQAVIRPRPSLPAPGFDTAEAVMLLDLAREVREGAS